jgi:hypothetical protein
LGFCVTAWDSPENPKEFVQIKNNGKTGERAGYIVQEVRDTAKKKTHIKRVRRKTNKKNARNK